MWIPKTRCMRRFWANWDKNVPFTGNFQKKKNLQKFKKTFRAGLKKKQASF